MGEWLFVFGVLHVIFLPALCNDLRLALERAISGQAFDVQAFWS
jgi:hypothetical protein